MSEEKNNILKRKKRKDNFTRVPNDALDNTKLSWKARGIYSYLQRKASIDGWRFRRTHLIAQSELDGKFSFDSAIKELKDAGFLIIRAKRIEGGVFHGYEWEVFDEPINTGDNAEEGKNKGGGGQNVRGIWH